jgi:hypothetical protein
MKTTENQVAEDTTQKTALKTTDKDLAIARPLKSLRPMKSMVRVKSFRPQKMEIGKTRKRVVRV